MRVRHPPGRAGRPWLSHRLEVARRGAKILDEKRRALFRERRRLQPLVARTGDEWERRAREAETWFQRAAVLGGERQLERARESVAGAASIEVGWRQVLGTACPSDARISLPDPAGVAGLGGSSALLGTAAACGRALEAAAQHAAARSALERVNRELERTTLRVNAIERRWIPAHEQALASLNLTLEELEREDAARIRLITRSREG